MPHVLKKVTFLGGILYSFPPLTYMYLKQLCISIYLFTELHLSDSGLPLSLQIKDPRV